MKHFKLFEEFNPYTGKGLIDKLKLYADASTYVTKTTPIVSGDKVLSFTIHTTIPADWESGTKTFEVIVPINKADIPHVETYESGKLVFNASLETKGEDEIDLILINFIEATQIYNDTIVQDIVDAYSKIKTIEDIKSIIKNQD